MKRLPQSGWFVTGQFDFKRLENILRFTIFGDVLSNLLKFNGNKVTKEYYINDYGNQINNFVESVFFRIQEIKYKNEFPKKTNLYPGLYIKDIAKKIINEHKEIEF